MKRSVYAFLGVLTCFVGCTDGITTNPNTQGSSSSAGGEGGIGAGAGGIGAGGIGAGGIGAGGIGVGGMGAGAGGMGVGAGGMGGMMMDGGPPAPVCKVLENGEDSAPTCALEAPADSFEPKVQWTWNGPPGKPNSLFTGSFGVPLVGNFTDDNGDGAIDLCDTPDVIISAIDTYEYNTQINFRATLHLLDGKTGTQILQFENMVDGGIYPAFADIDGDGLPEVLAADTTGHLVAYEHDGKLKWTSPVVGGYRSHLASSLCTTIAVYDLDGNGVPEILLGFEVFDNQGVRLFGDPTSASEFNGQYWCNTPTAADLDGDGKLEVVMGHVAFRSNGDEYYRVPNFLPAHPHIGNLDADPEPEIFLTNADGITLLEHTGAIKFGPIRPTDPNPNANCWGKPAVIHDFDGDGKADIASATCNDYTVYEVGASNLTAKWSNTVLDISGLATATAFDFLGDGVAEALYADETQMHTFDGKSGMTLFTAPRNSATLIEYPVVADVDNDGAAEILYVSNYQQGMSGPTLTVLTDAEERWIPARRIWNQYSYHVTNVREDGTIPMVMKKNWQILNTFHTNAQINSTGVDCNP